MHRHAVEPDDAILHTTARIGGDALTPVAPTAKVVYFGATYHADYATILAATDDLPAVADALVAAVAAPVAVDGPDPIPWDVLDLRRLRAGDPAADALAAAFDRSAAFGGWRVTREREEVCPVVRLAPGADFEAYLGSLGKKERHEVRRKIRRAEAAGDVRLEEATGTAEDLATFIDLHQKRWGADGLFPETPGGAQSRVFFRRLLDLGVPEGFVHLRFLTVDGTRIAAGLTFEDDTTSYFYNAGIEPAARDLSPGVLLSALSIRAAIEAGRTRFDYLRGDEPYKYEWGAVDEPIQRVLVVRIP
jgi:CelD/BcsL family acetyltransferase involved in cellulose biosynthesis